MRSLSLVILGLLLAMGYQAAFGQTDVSRSGSLKRGKCAAPNDPPVATFGWADIGTFDSGQTCITACGGYRLAPINSPAPDPTKPTNYLCRFSYTTDDDQTILVYGNYVPSRNNNPPACLASTPDGDVSRPATEGFECGCCGTINRNGIPFNTGCNQVRTSVPRNARCPRGTRWTQPAGSEICRHAPRNRDDAFLFGSIRPQNRRSPPARCFAPGGLNTTRWERVCYQINVYTGPPGPNC